MLLKEIQYSFLAGQGKKPSIKWSLAFLRVNSCEFVLCLYTLRILCCFSDLLN